MPEYYVFVKQGDARPEVDQLVRELRLSAEDAGLHKYIFATQARQTVVMLTDGATPLARALRGRNGWIDPSSAADN